MWCFFWRVAVACLDKDFLQEFAGLIAEKCGEPDEVCHGELGVAKVPALALDADFHAVEGVLVETELECDPASGANQPPAGSWGNRYRGDLAHAHHPGGVSQIHGGL